MNDTALAVDRLVARYGAIEALSGVNLHVSRGELIAVVGSNGAGKSTLLKVISGIHRAAEGTVMLGDVDITRTSADQRVRSGVVLVPEGRALFSGMTVRENIDLGSLRRKCGRDELEEIWTMFPRLYERRSQRAGTLSGGEQQMVALARGLVANPQVLLLDEPSLGLAPRLVAQMMQLLQKLNENGRTIVLVEQNAMATLRIASRAYVLASGRVALAGTARDLLEDEGVQRAYLGLAVAHA